MTQHIGQLHFESSAYCALCRTRLPDPFYDLDKQPPKNKAWEYKVLGFCNITSYKNPRILTIQADFKEPGTFFTSLRTDCGSLSVEICLESECRQCQGRDIAHIIHVPCWKLINKSRRPISAASIYQFAQSRHPLFDVGDALESEHDTLMDFTHDTIASLADTSLGHLLKRFLRLPAEIRSYISARCHLNLLSSIGTVSKISPLDIAKCSSGRNVIDFKHITLPNSLYTVETSILGQQYISSIAFDQNDGILALAADIRGIRFVIGRYGLCALGILYSNGSTSAWLGDPTNGWAGVIYGNDIRGFYVLQDDFKCLRIDRYNNKETRLKTVSRVMWDKLLDFTKTQYHQILDTNSPSHVRSFSGWRLCEYLPFYDNSGNISGLTMYCNGHGVTGIVAHSQTRTQIGQCQGCPVHFFLQKDEHIVSVWVRVPARYIKVENEPSILVTTNFSRSCLFGPCLPQNIITNCQYAWSLLCQDSCVLGIFYDILAVRRCSRITNIGVTQDIKSRHQLHQSNLPRIPFPDHRPFISQDTHTGIYFSNCKLDQIRSIQVCQRGLRYMGMAIDHYDGRSDVLGQWVCQNSAISTVYSQHQGTLSTISFRFLGQASNFYVDGIFLTIDNVDPPEIPLTAQSKLVSFELPSTHDLAWWFSRDYDEIEIWQESKQEINLSIERYDLITLE